MHETSEKPIRTGIRDPFQWVKLTNLALLLLQGWKWNIGNAERRKEGKARGGRGRATHVPTDGGGREEREGGRPIRELQTHRFFVRRAAIQFGGPI